ncbi:MAG TPA: AI-2E family transporter [Candidatus Dormibacteraeota bacterium]|nr:AI-2E family transporter [Candidatus Dormibacteraeota bacterium]
MKTRQWTLIFLAGFAAIAVFFCYLLVAPFLKAIVFSAIVAIIFYPLHARVHRWTRNRNVAAAISTSFVVLFMSTASLFLVTSVTRGLRSVYRSLSDPVGAANSVVIRVSDIIERFVAVASGYLPVSVGDLHDAISAQAEKIISGLLNLMATMLSSIASLAIEGAISLVVLFFLFRDGRSLARRVAVLLPMQRDQVRRLYEHVGRTLNAILYGVLAIAAIQGTLAGLAFWLLGITSPVLWGALTALCALVPVIGTSLVLFPVILILIAGGHWPQGLLLAAWSVGVVQTVDNLLRPYLIGGRARLSTVFVFFALLGGFEVFGGLGLFIGPFILATTVALLTFLREEWKSSEWNANAALPNMVHRVPKRAAR